MKHTRVVSTKCTPGFACRAFSDTTLVCSIVNEHTTKCSRYNHVSLWHVTHGSLNKGVNVLQKFSNVLPWKKIIVFCFCFEFHRIFVLCGQIVNTSALVQIMTRRSTANSQLTLKVSPALMYWKYHVARAFNLCIKVITSNNTHPIFFCIDTSKEFSIDHVIRMWNIMSIKYCVL